MHDFDIQKGVIVKSDVTYINIALNIGLDEKAFSLSKGIQFSCLLSCELLQLLLIGCVSLPISGCSATSVPVGNKFLCHYSRQ